MEILFKGVWSTVCGYNWDIDDATVVCNQLGYSSATAASSNATYGKGSGKIRIQNVNCHGNELDLLRCNFSERLSNSKCRHSEDAGVTCSKMM